MAKSDTSVREDLQPAVDRAVGRCHQYFRETQYPEGFWWGELESNPTMEAEYLLLCRFLGRDDPERRKKEANHILGKQQDDGSRGQYFEAPGDLSTTVECYFALKLAGYCAESGPLTKAKAFILSKGGVPKVRVFTKIWLVRPVGLEGDAQHAAGINPLPFVGAL